METSSPSRPAVDLSPHLYHLLVHALTTLLPPPLDDSTEALRTRNQAAIAKVAALLPVNANEAELAAECIAARAQAEDALRLLRQHANDIGLVMRLNAQYGSMVRASLSVHARLMRVQALRQKQEAIDEAATEDAWALHVAEPSMPAVADPKARRQKAAAQPEAPQVENAAPLGEKNVSQNGAYSHGVAFETVLSQSRLNRASKGSRIMLLDKVFRKAKGEPHLAGQFCPADGRGRAN